MAFLLAAFMVFFVGLVGCGREGGESGKSSSEGAIASSTSFLVDSKAGLPSCEGSRSGQLAYVKGESKFYGCDGAQWTEIAIKGEKGDKGEVGSSRPTSTGKIVSTLFCQGGLNLNGGIDFSALSIRYWASVNDNGDVWASADIVGQLASISGSRFYAKTQNGAETAAVNVTDDVYNTSGSGWWNIEVNRVTKIPTVVYNDIEMPVSGTRTWTFAASACTLNNY